MNTKPTPLSIDHYTQILKEKIWKGGEVYFDYDFISQFTKPWCSNIQMLLPNPLPSGREIMLAQKIYELGMGSIQSIDDFVDLILSVLQKSWFIASVKYLWGDFDPRDKKKLLANYSWKTFKEIFARYPVLATATSHWDKKLTWTLLLNKNFIDLNGFMLGVWTWDITIAKNAYHWMVDLGDDVLMYEDINHRYWIVDIHKKGNEPFEFTGKEEFIEDIKRIVEIYKEKSDSEGISLNELKNELDDGHKEEFLVKEKTRYKNIRKNQMNTLAILIKAVEKKGSKIFKTTKHRIKFIRKPKIYINGTLEDFRS